MAAIKKSFLSFAALFAIVFFAPLSMLQLVLGKDSAYPVLKWRPAGELYAAVLTTLDQALKTLLPEANYFKEEIHKLSDEQMSSVQEKADVLMAPHEKTKYFYVGSQDGEVLGYIGADSVQGKWGAIHYVILLSPAGEVKDVMVVEYQEKRGKPVAKKRFLRQFFGKTMRDPVRLQKDIRGVTGASISSRGMTEGIRKMIYVFNEVYRSGAS